MLLKRVITGFCIGIYIGVVIWLGDPWFTITACIVAALATFEFYRIVRHENIQPLVFPGVFFSLLFVLYAHITFPVFRELLFALLILLPLIWVLFKHDKDSTFINVGWTVMGVLYIGWMLAFYVIIRQMDNGMGWTFMILASTAMCDVFAYIIGSRLGRHPLASSISPGKTVEGAIGGLAASVLFSVLIGILFKLPLSYGIMVLAGLIIGVFAQIGDLIESLLKRNMKIKDAGQLLPGHGGILDRIDSHLMVAPLAYFLILLVTQQG